MQFRSLAAWLALAALALPAAAQASANSDVSGGGSVAGVEIPGLSYFWLQAIDPVPLDGDDLSVVVRIDDTPFILHLEEHSLRSRDFRALEVRDGVLFEFDAPRPETYRGAVYDVVGQRLGESRVAGSRDELGQWTFSILLEGDAVYVQPVTDFLPDSPLLGMYVTYRDSAVFGDHRKFRCGVDALTSLAPELQNEDPPSARTTGRVVTELAIDTDVEHWRDNNNSDTVQTLRDIEKVMNNVELIYERDTNITYLITAIVVRTGAATSDPYDSTDPPTILNTELAGEWGANFSRVRHDVIQLHSGKNLDGNTIGVANRSTICDQTFGVSLVESAFLPAIFRRAALSSHELGHNWSALHCDGTDPCYIMCAGIGSCNGIGSNVTEPEFAPISILQITNFASSIGCLSDEPDFLQVPVFDDVSAAMIDEEKWIFDQGVGTSRGASNEPTEERSFKLNAVGTGVGEQDELQSHFINLEGVPQGTQFVSFFSQHQGVEAGETLVVEWRNRPDVLWKELMTVTSDGIDQTGFQFHRKRISNTGYHERFRVRWRVTSDERNDNWYLDNLLIGDGPNLAQQPIIAGQTFTTEAHGCPANGLVAFLVGFGGLGSGPVIGNVTLDMLPPVRSLHVMHADGNGVARVDVPMPEGCSVTTLHTQAVVFDRKAISKSNVVAQTIQ